MNLYSPPSVTLADLRRTNEDRKPRNEVWGIPWHSADRFPGLAYCLGGRSVYWGGWAPRFLDEEMPTFGPSPWPQSVKDELQEAGGFFDQAAEEVGVSDPNDFINGDLHTVMRGQLFKAIERGDFSTVSPVSEAVPLKFLPDYIPPADIPQPMVASRAEDRGLSLADALAQLQLELRLDAPYAVQTRTRPGFFPTNKWSSVPSLIATARQAAIDSLKTNDTNLNNSRRQCMVVPRTNVRRLLTVTTRTATGQMRQRVTGIEVMRGNDIVQFPLAPNSVVVLACGAIESARIALNSFAGIPNYNQIGRNFMAHLRTNTQVVVPRTHPAFAGIVWNDLKVSALQLRGRVPHDPADLSKGYSHYHLQITASAVPNQETNNPEAQLFRKVPDLENIQHVREAGKSFVAIAVRGIGEMEPLNPNSFVQLDTEKDTANQIERAFVRINGATDEQPANVRLSPRDVEVKDAIVKATNAFLKLFDVDKRLQDPGPDANDNKVIKLDGMGTTYHESGTLRLGEDPLRSVINPDLRFHYVSNAYVTDMSILPTCGSANPVQVGVAFARRLASHLALPAIPTTPTYLFDGSSLRFWRAAGTSDRAYALDDTSGELAIFSSGNQLGLLWCMIPTPPDYELTLEFLRSGEADNSGVFVRFPDPNRPPAKTDTGYNNPAYIAIEKGFEIQICERDNGSSSGDSRVDDPRFRKTGVVYNGPGQQIDDTVTPRPPGQWNEMKISVQGQVYDRANA